MGLVDPPTVVTPVAEVPAPPHQGYILLPPELDAQAAQPNVIPVYQLVAHLRAFFGGGGHPADVNPQPLVVHHPGPNQVVVQAPEPIPALPPALGMLGFRRRARGCLAIAVLVIAISIRQGPGAVDAPRVISALGTGEGAVGADVLALGPAATQITVTLHVLPKPMAAGGPAVHWVDSNHRTSHFPQLHPPRDLICLRPGSTLHLRAMTTVTSWTLT